MTVGLCKHTTSCQIHMPKWALNRKAHRLGQKVKVDMQLGVRPGIRGYIDSCFRPFGYQLYPNGYHTNTSFYVLKAFRFIYWICSFTPTLHRGVRKWISLWIYQHRKSDTWQEQCYQGADVPRSWREPLSNLSIQPNCTCMCTCACCPCLVRWVGVGLRR